VGTVLLKIGPDEGKGCWVQPVLADVHDRLVENPQAVGKKIHREKRLFLLEGGGGGKLPGRNAQQEAMDGVFLGKKAL